MTLPAAVAAGRVHQQWLPDGGADRPELARARDPGRAGGDGPQSSARWSGSWATDEGGDGGPGHRPPHRRLRSRNEGAALESGLSRARPAGPTTVEWAQRHPPPGCGADADVGEGLELASPRSHRAAGPALAAARPGCPPLATTSARRCSAASSRISPGMLLAASTNGRARRPGCPSPTRSEEVVGQQGRHPCGVPPPDGGSIASSSASSARSSTVSWAGS